MGRAFCTLYTTQIEWVVVEIKIGGGGRGREGKEGGACDPHLPSCVDIEKKVSNK